MKPADLTGLTDEEIVTRCATEVMGWRLELCTTNDVPFPPHKYYAWHNEDAEELHSKERWNPLADWNHTMEVTEKMRKDGFYFRFMYAGFRPDVFCAAFGKGFISDRSFNRAICLAALRAVSSPS